MNTSDQIIKILNDLSNKLGVGIDWTHQNILPQIQDLMNRYAKYELYSSIMWLIVGLIPLSISIMFFMRIKKEKREQHRDEDLIFALWFGFLLFFIIGMLIIIGQINNIIQIKTIPETYFIDYVQKLLNPNLQ